MMSRGLVSKLRGGGEEGRREYSTKCGSNEVRNSLHNENRKWKVNVIQHPLQHRIALLLQLSWKIYESPVNRRINILSI